MSAPEEKEWIGYYSWQHSSSFGGVCLYESLDQPGSQVSVTCVTTADQAHLYQWPDKVSVGRVGRFVRRLSPPRLGLSWGERFQFSVALPNMSPDPSRISYLDQVQAKPKVRKVARAKGLES